uniref:DEP domain-containing protein n=1 Tax=Rhabditophanes sp. KR3021 TaxID=114890 RepID=A0AC35U3A1_9BILA
MGDDFQIDGDKLVSLLAIYLKLGLVDIESRLEGWISDDKVLKHQSIIYESCYKANLVQYSNLSKDLISTNFDVLYEIGAFDSLERDPFINLLDLDFIINKNQYLILDVITRWVEFEFQKRKMDWLHLITFINFQKIETKNLKEYMKINTNIYINPEMSLFFVNQLAEKIPEECIDQRKVDALENIYEAPTRIPSNMGNSNYSKMMLFGGTKDGNAVITIDVNQMTVTKERQLLYAKSRHCSERIENQVFVLGDFKNANIEKYDLSGNRNNSVLSFGMSSKKENYGSVLISDKIYVLAGYQDKRKIDIVEYLDPEKMTWIKESDLLDMASCPASVVVDNVMYVASKNRCNKIQRWKNIEVAHNCVVLIGTNNELSNHFKMNVPLKAHWSYFTCYEDTFTGKEAVNYMLEVVPYMTGSNLTRKQIIVLLQSLMYNKHLIRGNFMFVSVKDENETTFMDDSTIYKLTGDEQVRSPKKSLINSSLLDKLVALCSP